MVRHMPRPVWSEWADVPARCWNWIDPYVYFGDDNGNVYEMHPQLSHDDGQPIRATCRWPGRSSRRPAVKQFKMIQVFMITDGTRGRYRRQDQFRLHAGRNQPDVSFAQPGAVWDIADLERQTTGPPARPERLWHGVSALGTSAPRG